MNISALRTTMPMDDAKQKLMNIQDYLPVASDPFMREFARYLATQLRKNLDPAGFAIACSAAILNAKQGMNIFTREPVPEGLIGHSPEVYTALGDDVPMIVDAIFPNEFAATVKHIIKMAKETAHSRQR